MNTQTITEELLGILADHGVSVRSDAMGGGGGGLCVFKDKKVFFFDTDTGAYESACQCARAVLQAVGDLEDVYVKPAVREFLNQNSGSSAAE